MAGHAARALLAAAVGAGLCLRLEVPGLPRGRRAGGFFLAAALAALALDWTRAPRAAGEDFPAALELARAAVLLAAQAAAGAAAFAFLGRGALRGAALGLAAAIPCLLASRWPRLAAAAGLWGSPFAEWAAAAAAPALLAATLCSLAVSAAAGAGVLARAWLAVCLGWAAPTVLASELARGWGLGPASLSAAASVEPPQRSRSVLIARPPAAGTGPWALQRRRLADDRAAFTPESLDGLRAFLEARRHRHFFAPAALASLRRGWVELWEPDRALEAAVLSEPGRAHPDYLLALDLLKAGPLTASRRALLTLLEEASRRGAEGFEDVGASHRIFEGFSAAYARFGEEAGARRWLERIDNLWPISDRRTEVTPVEDLREGGAEGRLLSSPGGAQGVRVGLFLIWGATPATARRLLCAAAQPQPDGSFSFASLGPGRYELALMAPPGEPLSAEGPGSFEITYERPYARLPPIRVGRAPASGEEAASRPALARGAYPPASLPAVRKGGRP